jgi:hypothetical protein
MERTFDFVVMLTEDAHTITTVTAWCKCRDAETRRLSWMSFVCLLEPSYNRHKSRISYCTRYTRQSPDVEKILTIKQGMAGLEWGRGQAASV